MMKNKNHYLALVALSMLIILIYSCRKDFLSGEDINPEVEWAKNYFKESLLPNEGNLVNPHLYVENALRATLMSQKKENMKIPIWQKAMEGKTKLYDFVEVPLKYTSKVTPMLYIHEEGTSTVRTANKNVLKASLERLIIYKNKNGRIDQRIISFIPTEQYLARHNGDISHNRINKLDKDFDGTLIYRKWNGEFLFALLMKDGKAIKKLSLAQKMKLNKTAFRGEDCEDIDIYEWFQVCSYYGDDPNPYSCDEPYSEYVTTLRFCVPNGDDDPCLDPANFNSAECGGDVGCRGCDDELASTEAICDGLARMKAQARIQRIKSITESMESYNSNFTDEYGSEVNLSSPNNDTLFMSPNFVTDNLPDQVSLGFSWNSSEGYTVGWLHDHPAGTPPDLADLFAMAQSYYDPELVNAGSSAQQFYKDHVTTTVLTTDYTYKVTVKDWDLFLKYNNDFYKDHEDDITSAYQVLASSYQQANGSTERDALMHTLLQYYSTFFNIYRAETGTTNFKAMKLDSNGNITEVNCN
jgi:hypothetical protein